MDQSNQPQIDDAESRGNNKNSSTSDGGGGGGGGDDGGGAGYEIVAPVGFSDDLLEAVFSYLPMLSAARFPGLSKRFKDLWKSSSYIVFDRSLVGEKETLEVMRLVHNAVILHEGPKIDRFSVSISPTTFLIRDHFRRWIKVVAAKNVEEIELDYWPASLHLLPLVTWIFDAHSVKFLKLINVRLERLDMHMRHLHSMKNLRDLRLWNCDVTFFEDVFPMCRRLEHLEIIGCRTLPDLDLITENEKFTSLKVGRCPDLKYLETNAPNLKAFYYRGHISKVFVKGCVLERVFVSYFPATCFMPGRLFKKDLLAPSAASLKVLTANSVFIKALNPVFTPRVLAAGRSLFPNLTELHVYVEAFTYQTVGRLLNLLKRCPCLETLHVDLTRCGKVGVCLTMEGRRIALYTDDAHEFQHLKAVKIKGFTSSRHEHKLIEYLSMRSAALERVALVASRGFSVSGGPPILFSKSQLTKIDLYNFDDDQSCISPSDTESWC